MVMAASQYTNSKSDNKSGNKSSTNTSIDFRCAHASPGQFFMMEYS
ncbi:hypothetical protein AAKU67_000357 [Oxalobacteraceae bacterium GrIS 2.11]